MLNDLRIFFLPAMNVIELTTCDTSGVSLICQITTVEYPKHRIGWRDDTLLYGLLRVVSLYYHTCFVCFHYLLSKNAHTHICHFIGR